jgi:hypothetical protein
MNTTEFTCITIIQIINFGSVKCKQVELEQLIGAHCTPQTRCVTLKTIILKSYYYCYYY